ncbi:ATP-binding cassette sub-family A member 5 [Rana temporaria]|uniref:ATP-binding cassette sub-family A member 5 n=1 Tax=Rana temporaria TaxID=8407 RepID=UPI001AAD4AFF|nr:ATP-binding cassette sub-family A member 5 [Rana temporaria]
MTSEMQDVGVWAQTKTLLYKNYLVKCRTKKDTLQEILYPLIWSQIWLLLVLIMPNKYYEASPNDMLSDLEISPLPTIGYTPVTNATENIMAVAWAQCLGSDVDIVPYHDEESLKAASSSFLHFVGVKFEDPMSYKLMFFPFFIPKSTLYIQEHCFSSRCDAAQYHYSGFTHLQSCIDSAIIKLKTNHSAWRELTRTKVTIMEKLPMIEVDSYYHALMSICLAMAFLPFGCSPAAYIVAEKEKKLKEFMKILGLHDTAFWLPWVLLYIVFILLVSILMACITTSLTPFSHSSWFLVFLLYALYGISLIMFALMLTPLFKKAKQAGGIAFLSTLLLSALGIFIVLKEDFPKSFVWFLSPFCQCTFMIGTAQVMILEQNGNGAQLFNLKDGPYPLIITYIFLVVDSVMYLLLASYLDQILPGEYGLRRSPLFFLKPSYWSKRRRNYGVLSESFFSTNTDLSDVVEPVPLGLHGKEAIRIKNIHKSFKKENHQMEALQGLTLDIYEGQITALLGHSGTGKTTLMNILCGLCPPTEGVATIFGHRVTDIDEILDIRKMIGVCQQSDIHFEDLTVEENLSVFASLKGISKTCKELEINRILHDLDMEAVKHNQVKRLNVGQQRKLAVAIAVLGNPKVLLLDEPTAGMDSCSRYTVWNVLKKRKANSVIVFSTHCMEEADILADRKAVLSQGSLKCVGSSLFLKSKWGVSYRLSMDIKSSCNMASVSALVSQHIPGASLMLATESSLIYGLPLKDVDIFPGLFSALDNDCSLGILTYGVSVTTLEDVFFRLEAESDVDQTDGNIFTHQRIDDDRKWKSTEDIDQGLLTLPESDPCTVSGRALWKQQARTIAKLHFRNLYRDRKCVRNVCLSLLLFLAAQVTVNILHWYNHKPSVPIKLSSDLYFLRPGQKSQKDLTSLLLQSSTGASIDEIIDYLHSQRIKVDLMNGTDYMSVAPHSGALDIISSGKYFIYEVVFNSTMVHSLPVLINTISNTLLRQLNVNESIQVWSSPFPKEYLDVSYKITLYFLVIYLGILGAGMLPYFAMENIYNHKVKAYTQLKMSGLYQSAYWVGQASVDMLFFLLIISIMLGIMFICNKGISLYVGTFVTLVFCIIGYVPAAVLLTYVATFMYKSISDTRQWWSIFFSMMCLITITTVELASVIGNDLIFTLCHDLFSLFIPIYPLIGCLICFLKKSWKVSGDENSYTQLGRVLVAVLAPYIQCVILLLLLRHLEVKNGGKSIRKDPLFRTKDKKSKAWKFTEVPEDEDEDVRIERARVGEYMASDSYEKPAIMVSGLHKEYNEKGKTIVGKTMRKLVVNNISFCVRKGEILGLVGPNGCGKSTILDMMVGQTEPNAGKIWVGDPGPTETAGGPIRYVGYAPQLSHLWPEIRVQEHLETYGSIKGMSQSSLKEVIDRIVEALDMRDDRQKPTKKLSAGAQRKLCFALSMLGNPDIVLLDEPSTGMDPKAKQQLWKVIRSAFRGKEQAAVLTTHIMEEAEAVCDRVAVMVSGQLRYIGSVQHLKSKFGRHYSLELKLDADAGTQQMEILHREILKHFPNACRQESFASLMSYKVPKEDVQSLSQAFFNLGQVKRTFNVEEYSFSQSTLEQVFIELAKEQEEEDNFATMNSTLCWNRRQEDSVAF